MLLGYVLCNIQHKTSENTKPLTILDVTKSLIILLLNYEEMMKAFQRCYVKKGENTPFSFRQGKIVNSYARNVIFFLSKQTKNLKQFTRPFR